MKVALLSASSWEFGRKTKLILVKQKDSHAKFYQCDSDFWIWPQILGNNTFVKGCGKSYSKIVRTYLSIALLT